MDVVKGSIISRRARLALGGVRNTGDFRVNQVGGCVPLLLPLLLSPLAVEGLPSSVVPTRPTEVPLPEALEVPSEEELPPPPPPPQEVRKIKAKKAISALSILRNTGNPLIDMML